MKKLLALTLLLTTAFALTTCGSTGTSVPKAENGTRQTASAPTPQAPYFSGNGRKGTSLAILVPAGTNLTNDVAYLPNHVQGRFVSDLTKFSAMDVLDRQSLEKVLIENESGIYAEGQDFAELGKIAGKDYYLSGSLTKTASAYALQVQITNTKTGNTEASYSGSCMAQELDDFTAVKKASLDLLTQMGVELTSRGREELLEAGSEQSINAETALAKGITAQRSGTTVETLAYYYQAAAFDPSLAEAVSRASVMSADISSGNIGQNVRNDIAWRDAWVARLTETENFFRDYIKTMPSYDFVYSTDLNVGATNYQDRTVSIGCEVELLFRPTSMVWFDTMNRVVNTVKAGLFETGRAEAWGLAKWPIYYDNEYLSPWTLYKVSNGKNPFDNYEGYYTIVMDLVNNEGVSLGSQSFSFRYGWYNDDPEQQGYNKYHATYTLNVRPRRNPASPGMVLSDIWQRVTFPAVNADLITDKLTLKVVSVDGIAAETAVRDGYIRITTKGEYDQSRWDNIRSAYNQPRRILGPGPSF
ncbi:hypothetical protein FACS189483_04250 [Spirochaetia bacterium]|nr:hypothetical protein FACS189483_04250 [Spirochaetia bacterium]